MHDFLNYKLWKNFVTLYLKCKISSNILSTFPLDGAIFHSKVFNSFESTQRHALKRLHEYLLNPSTAAIRKIYTVHFMNGDEIKQANHCIEMEDIVKGCAKKNTSAYMYDTALYVIFLLAL